VKKKKKRRKEEKSPAALFNISKWKKVNTIYAKNAYQSVKKHIFNLGSLYISYCFWTISIEH